MMLYLLTSLLASQLFVVSTSVIGKGKMGIGEENKVNSSISGPENPEIPSFLLTIYNQLMMESESYLLEIFPAERDQATGEFYFLPSALRTPSQPARKADFFLSTQQFAANELTVSIYATGTGTKVNSRNLSSSTSGWLHLPATEMLNQWNARVDASFRFKLFIKVGDGNESEIVDHVQVPRVWIVLCIEAVHESLGFPPLARDSDKSPYSDDRARRQIGLPAEKVKRNTGCRKIDMIVNSRDLSNRVKIVYPRSFNAYQCSGKCYLTEKRKFVNHSILRALVNQKKETTSAGEPCCVPTKLKSIGLIHSTSSGGFVISTIEDMIVEECKCY